MVSSLDYGEEDPAIEPPRVQHQYPPKLHCRGGMCDDSETCSGDSSDDSGIVENLQGSEISHVSPRQNTDITKVISSCVSPKKSAFSTIPMFGSPPAAERVAADMCLRLPFAVPALNTHGKLDGQTTSAWSSHTPPAFPVSVSSFTSRCAKQLPDYHTSCSSIDTSIPFTTYLMNLTQFLHKSSTRAAPSTTPEAVSPTTHSSTAGRQSLEGSASFLTFSPHLSIPSPLRQQLAPHLRMYAKPQAHVSMGGGSLSPSLDCTHPAFLQLRSTPHRRQTMEKPPPIKKYKCDTCGKAFSRSNTLVTHKRIHTGDKPFKCDQCGRAFRQPGNLTRHRLTHTTFKPYVCPTCNKAFNRASNLHTHMRTHTNYKPFVCPYCGKSFHQKIDMKIHCYTHTGQRPHKCDSCGKGFTLSSTLNAHRRTHLHVDTARTPEVQLCFSCHVCRLDFPHHSDLTTHIMTSHSHISV